MYELYHAGDYEALAEKASDAMGRWEGEMEPHLYAAIALWETTRGKRSADDVSRAEFLLQRALDLDGSGHNGDVRLWLGRVLAFRGGIRADEAEAHFVDAADLVDGERRVAVLQEWAALLRRKLDPTAEELDRAAQLYVDAANEAGSGQDAWPHVARSVLALEDMDRVERAAFVLQGMIDKPLDARHRLASLLLQLGRHEDALVAFDECLELDSDYAPAWAGLAKVQELMGNLDVAMENYEQVMRLDKVRTDTAVHLAALQARMGHWAAVVHTLGLQHLHFGEDAPLAVIAGLAKGHMNALQFPASLPIWNGLVTDLENAVMRARVNTSDSVNVVHPADVAAQLLRPSAQMHVASLWAQRVNANASSSTEAPVETHARAIGFLLTDQDRIARAHLAQVRLLRRSWNVTCVLVSRGDDGAAARGNRSAVVHAWNETCKGQVVAVAAGDAAALGLAVRTHGLRYLVDVHGWTPGSSLAHLGETAPATRLSLAVGTTGTVAPQAGAIDFVVSDSTSVDAALVAQTFTERVVLMAGDETARPTSMHLARDDLIPVASFDETAYDPTTGAHYSDTADSGRLRREYSLPPANRPMMCTLDGPLRVDPLMLRTWMDIMRRVPDAVLVLAVDGRMQRTAVLNLARKELALSREELPARIRFAPRPRRRDAHLVMALCDLVLESSVQNARSSAIDYIYAGVPILALAHGATGAPGGRTTPALIRQLLPEADDAAPLLAESMDEYADKAVRLLQHRSDVLMPLRLRWRRARLFWQGDVGSRASAGRLDLALQAIGDVRGAGKRMHIVV